jgi:glycosyltransferase involved in cell wall biosynthesis
MTSPAIRRIVFLNHDVHLGGAELSLLDMIASIGTAAPEVERHLILGGASGPMVDQARSLGVQTHVVEFPPLLAGMGETALYSRGKLGAAAQLSRRALPAMFAGRDYAKRLHRKIAELRPDIAHSNALKSHFLVSVGRFRTCPLIWHVRDFLGSRPLMVRCLKMVSSSATRAIGISEAVAKDVRQSLPNLPVDVVYDSIDVDAFHPGAGDGDELDRLAGLPPAPAGTVRVGLVATYARWKGHDLFIEAVSKVQTGVPCRFYIIGGPIYTTKGSQFSVEELRSLASRHGVESRVGFIPFQPRTAEIYRALDIVVQTSTKPEPFGRTIAEAMAAGRPVVISKGGGAAELFRDDFDGVGFTPGSADSLSAAMSRLISDPALRERIGQNAQTTAAERFYRDRIGPEVFQVYERALQSRSSRSRG